MMLSRGKKLVQMVLASAQDDHNNSPILCPEENQSSLDEILVSIDDETRPGTDYINLEEAEIIFVDSIHDGTENLLLSSEISAVEEVHASYEDSEFTNHPEVHSLILLPHTSNTDLLTYMESTEPMETEIQESFTHDEITEQENQEKDDHDDPNFIPDETEEQETREYDDTEKQGKDLPKRKRSKRQHVKESSWSQNQQKQRRERGLTYSGKKKQDQKWNYKIKKSNRSIKPRCNCSTNLKGYKCCLFTEIERNQIYNDYWSRTWAEKRLLVQLLVDIKATKRYRDRKQENVSRRKASAYYHLLRNQEKVRVCKKMFLNTFSIGEWSALNWAKRNAIQEDIAIPEACSSKEDDQIFINNKSKSRISLYEDRKKCLVDFFNSLAKMESHYCRSSSSKLYLEPNWISKTAVYEFYSKQWCTQLKIAPLSLAAFFLEFKNQNLSLFSPKKDKCETCGAYEAKNVSEEDYKQHKLKVHEARKEKEADKENNTELSVFTMDLQSVLLSPKSNISSMYYKTKLIVHNFTLFNLKTKDGFCFLWNESEGNVSANEFSTILSCFISKLVQDGSVNHNKIILYSDGCTAQNRNSTLANALLNVSLLYNITIEQKFLCKGHTQMEADSMHSCIERIVRKTDINVPADYINICKNARKSKPYEVHYLDHSYFRNMSAINFYKSIRPGKKKGDPCVTDIVALKYAEGEIFHKLKFDDPWCLLPARLDPQIKPMAVENLPPLYKNKIKITKRKYDDLQDLKVSLPKDFHDFYDKIPHQES